MTTLTRRTQGWMAPSTIGCGAFIAALSWASSAHAEVNRCRIEANANGKYAIPKESQLEVPKAAEWEPGAPLEARNGIVRGVAKLVLFVPRNIPAKDIAALEEKWPPCDEPSSGDVKAADTREGEKNWYFIVDVPSGGSIEVTLPTGFWECKEQEVKTDAGTTTKKYVASKEKTILSYTNGQFKKTIKVTTTDPATKTPTKCDDGDYTLEALPYDALALKKALTPRPSFSQAPTLSLVDPRAIELSFGLATPNLPGFRENNTIVAQLDATHMLEGSWMPGCTASACKVQFRQTEPFTSAQWSLDFRLSSPGIRKLAETPNVYYVDGKPVQRNDGDLGAVSKWDLPRHILPTTVAPKPLHDTRIPVDSALAFFLENGQDLACQVPLAAGTPTEKCARFFKDGASSYLTLTHEVGINQLATESKTLMIHVPKAGAALTSPVSFEVSTFPCEYGFTQLTRTVAGLHEAEVLYWVEPQRAGCLAAPLHVYAPSHEQDLPVRHVKWLYRSGFDKGVLSITFSSLPNKSDGPSYDLAARQSTAANARDVNVIPERPFRLSVERGLAATDIALDVEISELDAPEASARLLESQPFFAVNRRNRLRVFHQPLTGTKTPWTFKLLPGNYKPIEPTVGLGTNISVHTEGDVLPSVFVGKEQIHFLTATADASAPPGLRAGLKAKVEDFLTEEGRTSLRALGAAAESVTSKSLDAGYVDLTLTQGAKRYWLPWSLDRASIICSNEYSMTLYGEIRGLKPKDYKDCKLVVPVDSGVLSAQQIVISGAKEDASGPPVVIGKLAFRDFDFCPPDKDKSICDMAEECAKLAPNKCELTAKLPPLLGKLGEVADYKSITITVTNATAEAEFEDTDLKDAYTPSGVYNIARRSSLQANTRLLPAWTTRSESATWGARYYFTFTTGLKAWNSRGDGYGVDTSTSYSQKLQANFDWGGLFVVEPWNFSANKPTYFPIQAMVGLLGPTTFTRERIFEEVSLVAGLGFRPFVASKPGSGPFEAGTSLVAWWSIHGGGRDGYVSSLLFGANITLGSAAY